MADVFSNSSAFYSDDFGGLVTRAFDPLGSEMVFNADQAERDRQFNAAEAQKYRDWTEYMSNTQYTRGAANMLEAGLNPYSMYGSSGSGASFSGGTAASAGSGARIGSGSVSLLSRAASAVIDAGLSVLTKGVSTLFTRDKGDDKYSRRRIGFTRD